jgi:erythromycin esterase
MLSAELTDEIVRRSVPFVDIKDFSPLIDRVKDKRIVMLGESTHGTKEFYEWRSSISAELIEKHGFSFIAVEGDWPPCQEINRYIQRKNQLGTFDTLDRFSRWPTWMWGNTEMVGLLDWLKEYNLLSNRLVGFHGLDVYSLFESMEEVVQRLTDIDPDLARKVMNFYECFEPYRHDERSYARSLFSFPAGCEVETLRAMTEILKKNLQQEDAFFDVEQNARIVQNAEKYYRSMVFSVSNDSWNVRDQHMLETLDQLLDRYGEGSKVIVWAHNTHIGDYRGTDMPLHGHINLGGIAREKYGPEQVALVGFTTYTGEVIASPAWDGEIEEMVVPEAQEGSLEDILHQAIPRVGHENYYLTFEDTPPSSPLYRPLGHRAVGVVYDPRFEGRGNYVPTVLPERYDALVFLNETSALSPLPLRFDRLKIPETYPFGARA